MIDAGASTPEELRALAARIREHRALEDQQWRSEVKPALLESKKRKIWTGDRPQPADGRSSLRIGVALLAGVLVLLLAAAQGSFLLILLPVVGVLGYAYWNGRQDPPGGGVGTLGP